MSSYKDSKKLIRIAKQHGWTVERRKKTYQLTSPEGFVVTLALTPSHTRTYKNALAHFRRAGMDI